MTDMNRRNFLFGTVAAAASGTALVLAGRSEDFALFKPTLAETLAISRVPAPSARVINDPWGIGDVLYNADGVPVLHVRGYSVNANVEAPINISAYGDVHETFIAERPLRLSMEVDGYPTFKGSRARL